MTVMRVLAQQEDQDCAIVALAMVLGREYGDVLRVVTVADRHQGKRGLWTRTIQRVAKRLGVPLKRRRAIDWSDDCGILLLPDHAAVLWNGLVVDNLTIWDCDVYLADRHLEPHDCELLTYDESPL